MAKKFNKESYQYYTKMYNANKSNYKKRGFSSLIPEKMNLEEWTAKHDNQSNREIVWNEFHEYTREQSAKLREALDVAKKDIYRLSRGQISKDEWDKISQTYKDATANGMTSTQAKAYVSHMFWGSP